MHFMMRSIAALGLAIAVSSPAAATDVEQLLDWNALVDEAAQSFEDPYRSLAPELLSDLVAVVRFREQLESGAIPDEARPRIEARLGQKEDALRASGVDIDWLIAQRWVVAERRKKAAFAANPDLDGEAIEIGGFLIPAPPTEDGEATAYLVPQRGMCAHTPPPPPNQLVQIVFGDLPTAPFLYSPAVVTGTLRMVETRREVMVVDGIVPMLSSWTLEGEAIELFTGSTVIP